MAPKTSKTQKRVIKKLDNTINLGIKTILDKQSQKQSRYIPNWKR